MKCLIIAAGRGSRLRQLGDSKPLVPVLGVPLIERTIRFAIEVGAEGVAPESFARQAQRWTHVALPQPDADDALQIVALGHNIERALDARKVKLADFPEYDLQGGPLTSPHWPFFF